MYNNYFNIDLQKLQYNYQNIKDLTKNNVGCVVKSNAYGFGATEIALTLYDSGATIFFVNSFAESLEIHKCLGYKVKIIVFDGIIPNNAPNNILPAVINITQLKKYKRPVWIHFDSGINRTGINIVDFEKNKKLMLNANVDGVMSHLAYKGEKNNYHYTQLKLSQYFFNHFNCQKSLSKSIGLNLGEHFWFDTMRIGHALYFKVNNNTFLENIGDLYSYILSISTVKKDEIIGYDGLFIAKYDMKIAIVNCGYADGIQLKHDFVSIHGILCAVIGEVSMNYFTIDVSHMSNINIGDKVNITHNNIHNLAHKLKCSMGYFSTSIHKNVQRVYINK